MYNMKTHQQKKKNKKQPDNNIIYIIQIPEENCDSRARKPRVGRVISLNSFQTYVFF